MKLRLTLLFALMVPALFAGHHKNNKVDKDFDQADDNSTMDVIVQYKQTPTSAHHQKVTQRGGQYKRELGLIKAGHYRLPLSKLQSAS